MLDNIVEQEKDLKLYELICKGLLSEKDFKKIIDKCRYDEENDEWIIPFIKKKQNVEIYEASNNMGGVTSGNTTNRGGYVSSGGGGSLLPDIHHKGPTNVKESEQFDQTMKFSAAMTFNLGGGTSGGTKKDKPGSTGKLRNDGSVGKIPVVPLLTLPGHLISASSLLDSQSDRVESSGYNGTGSYSQQSHHHGHDRSSARSEYEFPAVSSSITSGRANDHGPQNNLNSNATSAGLPGIGFEKKKQTSTSTSNTSSSLANAPSLAAVKAPNKIPKIPPGGNSTGGGGGNKMPLINGSHSYQDYGYDHNGSNQGDGDQYSSSHYDDYGGEDIPPTSARVKKKKHRDRDARGSRDYTAEPSSARGGGSSSLPPIGMKHATPRLGGGGGGGLPPI